MNIDEFSSSRRDYSTLVFFTGLTIISGRLTAKA
jgi:hypothetical protein